MTGKKVGQKSKDFTRLMQHCSDGIERVPFTEYKVPKAMQDQIDRCQELTKFPSNRGK